VFEGNSASSIHGLIKREAVRLLTSSGRPLSQIAQERGLLFEAARRAEHGPRLRAVPRWLSLSNL
jgi:hypothetical protein